MSADHATPTQLAGIEKTIVHTRAAMECLERILDMHWEILGVLAEIKTTGRMSIAQRSALRDWLEAA